MFEKIINYIKEKTTKKQEIDTNRLVLCNIMDYELHKTYNYRLRKDIVKPISVPRENCKNYIAKVLTVSEKERYINSTYKGNKPDYLYYDPYTVYFQLVNHPEVILPALNAQLLAKLDDGKYSSIENIHYLKDMSIDINSNTDFVSLENELNENQKEQN